MSGEATPSARRIFVTGAEGLVGRAFVGTLLAHGYAVRVLRQLQAPLGEQRVDRAGAVSVHQVHQVTAGPVGAERGHLQLVARLAPIDVVRPALGPAAEEGRLSNFGARSWPD